jgi:hypothetical protein
MGFGLKSPYAAFKVIPSPDQTENLHVVLTTVKTAEEDYGNIRIPHSVVL